MTTSSCVPHGPELDDCCSNAFALTDLCGLKWRKYIHAGTKITDPSRPGDPVLSSYSSALAQDILCAWRSTPRTPKKAKESLSDVNVGKEFWVFWYGDEPNLVGIVSSQLIESSSGCWEDGLTHEPRTLLFKALHNLLERCLLSKKFVRLGRWFVKPNENSDTCNSEYLSFSFSFFVHGESTVCTAVEIQQGPKVRSLVLEDLVLASTRPEGLEVLLSPFGQSGFITGQSQHVDDEKTSRFLEDWSRFYPLDSGTNWTAGNTQRPDQEVPAMVMVISGEANMIYPSAYVMVACSDKGEVFAPSTDAMQCAIVPSSVSLTPPSSPSDPINTDASKTSTSDNKSSSVITSSSCVPSQSLLPKSLPNLVDKKKLTQALVQEVWREITAPKPPPSKLASSKLVPSFVKPETYTAPSPGGEVSLIGQPLWEFEEPFKRSSCACTSSSNLSRPKPATQVRTSFGISRPIPSPNHPLPSPQQQQQQQQQQPQQQQTTQTTMKLKKEKKKPISPFHHRPLFQQDVPDAVKCYVSMATKGLSTVNSLTSINHRRHSDCSRTYLNKYVLPAQPANNKQTNSLGTSDTNFQSNNVGKIDKCGHPVSDKLELSTKSEISASTNSQSLQGFSKYMSKSLASKTHKKTYMFPGETSFAIPSLPGNSLDCRPLPSLPSPSTPSSNQAVFPSANQPLFPSASQPLFPSASQPLWESSGVKRPSLDVEIESAPSPAKKTKREPSIKSVAPGRPRSDSSSSAGRRGRRTSSIQSPTVPITPSPFPIKTEEPDVEMTMTVPPIKSPTQGRGSRQRRRSSTSSAASPSVPSPVTIEQPKPNRPRQRRQSTRKQQQQQEEKEKQLKEQEEEQMRFDTSMQKILPSPPTPRQIPLSNLMTDKDLMVTANDLDQLFDLDDDDDNLNGTNASGNNCNNHIGHGTTNKSMDTYNPSQTTVTTGVVASQDLARMYPTPPSLEPVAHSPPCSGPDYISPGSVKTMTCSMATSPETHVVGLTVGIDAEHKHFFSPKELGQVFEIPNFEDFPMTSSFGPVTGLPSEKKPLAKSFQKLVYKAKWQMPQATEPSNSTSQNEKCINDNEIMQTESTLLVPSPAIGSYHGDVASVSSDPRQYTTLSPLSPASSISSFTTSAQFSKQIPGRMSKIPSKLLAATSLPQTSALSKILSHSDSELNYFSDKNFDNVNLCVCAVQILSKPDPKGLKHRTLLNKRLDSNRCTCGFLTLEQYKFGKGQGLFPEDELCVVPTSKTKAVTTTGRLSTEVKRDESMPVQDPLFGNLVEIVVDQCSSPFSCATMKHQMLHIVKQAGNSVPSDNAITNKGNESRNTTSVTSTVAVSALHNLRQILQEALQKSTSRKTWEQPNGTMVQGPLSWKQLHHIAVKGAEESPQAQPIPSMLVGNGGDWMSLSPFSFQFWEKLLLEPFSTKRDVAYVVVAPENDPVLTSTKLFFKELSSLYETCRLGQHVPIAKLRDGILRVGQKSLKLSKENVDDWFSQQSTTSEGARLKLYALVCKHHLAPLLSTLKVDRHLLDRDKADDKLLKPDNERTGFPYSGSDGSKTGTIGTPTTDSASTPPGDDEESISDEPPTIVVYLVDPFTGSNGSASSISYVGLLRCFAEMTQGLTDNVKSNVVLQVVPLNQILQVDNMTKCRETSMSFIMQLKCLAFSVFSRCRKTIQMNMNAKSLTGFGPAAGQEASVKNKEVDMICLKLYSCPFVLDTPIMPVIETIENGVDKVIPANRSTLVLHCGYCLSRDQRWLLTVCTDGTGEVIETNAISVVPPLRADGRPRKTPTRTKALRKIWEFCLGVIASSLSSWRLVICKMGRMGQGEIRDWKEILSKTSYETRESFGREACNACFSLRSDLRPVIIGTSLIALEPEPALRMYMAKGLTKASTNLDANHQTPVTSITKPDVSRSYITVFTSTYHYKGTNKPMDNKTVMTPETTTETVITDTDILLAGADDESDPDPLRHLFPLLNTSPTPLSPSAVLLGSPLTSPLDDTHLHSSSPHTRVSNLTSSPSVSVHSPFQPIGRGSPFQPVAAASPSKSVTSQAGQSKVDDDCPILQPLAQGYVISTVHTGKLPSFFWANYPQAEKLYPVILRASMFLHNPEIIEMTNGFTVPIHPLNSHANCDVLKYILQQFDALSWLTIDPVSRDRRSCLPVHLCMLSQLHDAFIHLLEKTEC